MIAVGQTPSFRTGPSVDPPSSVCDLADHLEQLQNGVVIINGLTADGKKIYRSCQPGGVWAERIIGHVYNGTTWIGPGAWEIGKPEGQFVNFLVNGVGYSFVLFQNWPG